MKTKRILTTLATIFLTKQLVASTNPISEAKAQLKEKIHLAENQLDHI
jgi:hypothetical protein